MTVPTPVTTVDADPAAVTDRLPGPRVPVDEALLERLRSCCEDVSTDESERNEAGRDWWPIAIRWATKGSVVSRPGAIARPRTTSEVAAVLACCNEARVPVTAAGGRSGVCGSSVPVFGGVALDMTHMNGITDVDTLSLLADVRAGTFGPEVEKSLRDHGVTLGHWPQSMDLSTVGGWIACRGAGQYSTRYGKIEDMVEGLTVALADGTVITTGGTAPRAAVGPDLNQLFVGSEGTFGIITEARLRVHPVAPAEGRRAWGFADFAQGLDACRRVLRRGATPAVLRLYDHTESERTFVHGSHAVLIALDEADPIVLEATLTVLDEECGASGAEQLGRDLVQRWMDHRNDVSALAPLYRAGIVVDTVEVAGRWSVLPGLYSSCVRALESVEGTLVASAHQSHAYTDGACIYLTFAGRMPETETSRDPDEWAESYYSAAWQAVMDVVIGEGAAISHHHGIGVNRSRFMAAALGSTAGLLESLKFAIDPRGILNPGKLGLPSPYG
ncbi:MAG TPA: FAD-binding oxidoreductase, partial [Acidimicrobiales bacterium]|nr:FAD-binding oxidoreductase [Acidimicrobiales bacterium]